MEEERKKFTQEREEERKAMMEVLERQQERLLGVVREDVGGRFEALQAWLVRQLEAVRDDLRAARVDVAVPAADRASPPPGDGTNAGAGAGLQLLVRGETATGAGEGSPSAGAGARARQGAPMDTSAPRSRTPPAERVEPPKRQRVSEATASVAAASEETADEGGPHQK